MTPADGTAHAVAEDVIAWEEAAPSDSAERIRIALDEIFIPPDRRALQPEKVADLVQSMKVLGLLAPVAVRWVRKQVNLPNGLTVEAAYHLVYGHHRVAAARELGWKEIPCRTLFSSTAAIADPSALQLQGSDRHAWMVEIAENLHRAELTALERSEHIAAWIKLIAENSLGSDETQEAPSEPSQKGSGRPKGGRSAAAREIGISEADARRSERIAALPDEAKAEAKALGLDDNQVALLKATRAADPVIALRDHSTHSKEAPPSPTAKPTATASVLDEPSSKTVSVELSAAMEATKKLSPEDLSAFLWWVRATFPFSRILSETVGNTGVLTPISGLASAAASLLRARSKG
jgi:hypothetical protein